jgi:hypothetical protein
MGLINRRYLNGTRNPFEVVPKTLATIRLRYRRGENHS